MLDHIYFKPKLENHESVLNFENIKGVNRNMYFVDHDESEVGLTFTKSNIQLFRERLSEKNVHAIIPKGNMRYDQYTVPVYYSCRTYF